MKKITIEHLKEVFNEYNLREEKFVVDNFEFITNGHFAIGIKSELIKDFNKEKSKILKKYINVYDFNKNNFDKIIVENDSIDHTPCKKCNGKGKIYEINIDCTCDCGYVYFYDEYNNEYECDCIQCEGKGSYYIKYDDLIDCYKCKGSGLENNLQFIKINKTVLNYELFKSLELNLPNIKWYTGDIQGYQFPFIFDGGIGILMIVLYKDYDQKTFCDGIFKNVQNNK